MYLAEALIQSDLQIKRSRHMDTLNKHNLRVAC